jgi:[acyl-carrier-protein] S-malonyltransferase
MVSQMWEVVGGVVKEGIVVREGEGLSTPQFSIRLSTGSLIQEVEMKGKRLRYRLAEGSGPPEGWITPSVSKRELAVRTSRVPSGATTPPELMEHLSQHWGAEPPLPIGILFPGQGSQYVKMLAEVKDMPRVREMLQKSTEILGWDVLELCLAGPEEKLEETAYCQPAMFIAGLAGVEKLRAERPEAVDRCSVMAGLSLGEYTALCAAGVMGFEDGLWLVKVRGEAMQEAAKAGRRQLMLSVVGLEEGKVTALCEEARDIEGSGAVCGISNYLFPKGYSVGGTEVAIKELEGLATKAGALQVKVLKTGGAFHTALMQPAQDRLSAAIDEIQPRMKPPAHTVWMNASAEPCRPGSDVSVITALMKKQLTNPVYWEQSVREIRKEGITEFYECGPMKQIKAMMKRTDPDAWKNTTNIMV